MKDRILDNMHAIVTSYQQEYAPPPRSSGSDTLEKTNQPNDHLRTSQELTQAELSFITDVKQLIDTLAPNNQANQTTTPTEKKTENKSDTDTKKLYTTLLDTINVNLDALYHLYYMASHQALIEGAAKLHPEQGKDHTLKEQLATYYQHRQQKTLQQKKHPTSIPEYLQHDSDNTTNLLDDINKAFALLDTLQQDLSTSPNETEKVPLDTSLTNQNSFEIEMDMQPETWEVLKTKLNLDQNTMAIMNQQAEAIRALYSNQPTQSKTSLNANQSKAPPTATKLTPEIMAQQEAWHIITYDEQNLHWRIKNLPQVALIAPKEINEQQEYIVSFSPQPEANKAWQVQEFISRQDYQKRHLPYQLLMKGQLNWQHTINTQHTLKQNQSSDVIALLNQWAMQTGEILRYQNIYFRINLGLTMLCTLAIAYLTMTTNPIPAIAHYLPILFSGCFSLLAYTSTQLIFAYQQTFSAKIAPKIYHKTVKENRSLTLADYARNYNVSEKTLIELNIGCIGKKTIPCNSPILIPTGNTEQKSWLSYPKSLHYKIKQACLISAQFLALNIMLPATMTLSSLIIPIGITCLSISLLCLNLDKLISSIKPPKTRLNQNHHTNALNFNQWIDANKKSFYIAWINPNELNKFIEQCAQPISFANIQNNQRYLFEPEKWLKQCNNETQNTITPTQNTTWTWPLRQKKTLSAADLHCLKDHINNRLTSHNKPSKALTPSDFVLTARPNPFNQFLNQKLPVANQVKVVPQAIST
jgi:hypothetical protein